MTASSPALRALFQQRVTGDAALLELARLRFAQAGMAAEVYADTPEQLEPILGFVPPHPHLPTVHFNRGVNVLQTDELARGLRALARISFCIDTGHVGIKQARNHLARTEPGGNLGALRLGDPRLPELAGTHPDHAR